MKYFYDKCLNFREPVYNFNIETWIFFLYRIEKEAVSCNTIKKI